MIEYFFFDFFFESLPQLGPIQMLAELMRIKQRDPLLYHRLKEKFEEDLGGSTGEVQKVSESLEEEDKKRAGGGRFSAAEDVVDSDDTYDYIETDSGVELRVAKESEERDYFGKSRESDADARETTEENDAEDAEDMAEPEDTGEGN